MDMMAFDYRLSDGSPCLDVANNAYVTNSFDLSGAPRIQNDVVDIGAYEGPYGTSAATLVHYVSLDGSHTAPFDAWATAATNIQAAVDAATDGDIVLVADGTYQSGGVLSPTHALSNRVVLVKAVRLQSVNGPDSTFILGAPDPVTGSLGSNAMRCIYLDEGAELVGFTLSNGYTQVDIFGDETRGGGAFLYRGGTISNCVISGNTADVYGGGVYADGFSSVGMIHDSLIQGNISSFGGGIYNVELISGSTIERNVADSDGGGIYHGEIVSNCVIKGNIASFTGGGSYNVSLVTESVFTRNEAYSGGGLYAYDGDRINNSLIYKNIAYSKGGGLYGVLDDNRIDNCTIVYNQAGSQEAGIGSHSLSFDKAYNSILYFNSLTNGMEENYQSLYMQQCCTRPDDTNGILSLITADPLFRDAANDDYRLRHSSPCINAGNNSYVQQSTDLEGKARIFNGTTDIGAYESHNQAPVITEGTHVPVSVDEESTPLPFALTLHAGDANNDALTWHILTSPSHGTMGLESGTGIQQVVSYVPETNYNGSDQFIIEVEDSAYATDSVVVNVTVQPRNDAPTNEVAPWVGGTPKEGQTLTLNEGFWLDNIDQTPGTLQYHYQWWRAQNSEGLDAEVISGATGQTYVVQSLDNGAYLRGQVSAYDDGEGLPTSQTTTLHTVWQLVRNASPVIQEADPQSVVMDEDGNPTPFALTLQASDPNNDTLHWWILPQATNGIAVVSGTGNLKDISYTPAPNSYGIDRFGVYVSDQKGGLDSLTVNVMIQPVNDMPTISGMPSSLVMLDTPYSFTPLAGDIDVGDVLTFTVTNLPAWVNFDPNTAALTGTPTSADLGTTTDIILSVHDGKGGTASLAAFNLTVQPSIFHYVSLQGNHTYPYTSWTTAATNIQAAINAADTGDRVLVTNGVYTAGGAVAPNTYDLFNRVALTNALTVQSVEGPEVTMIVGSPDPFTGGLGTNAVRCAYLTDGAELIGFTLSNGYTRASSSSSVGSGGGAFLDQGGVLSDCIVRANNSYGGGGGIYLRQGGSLQGSIIQSNQSEASGGGIYCYYGGTVDRSLVSENIANDDAGGIRCFFGGTINNSLIIENSANDDGGGVQCFSGGTINNSTIAFNTSDSSGGGLYAYNGGEIHNTIIYYNSGLNYSNYYNLSSGMQYEHCLSEPLISTNFGSGNLTGAPLFADAQGRNYHLQFTSPCIDAGKNSYVIGEKDLDSQDRIRGGVVDLGAYELNYGDGIPVLDIITPPAPVAYTVDHYDIAGTNNAYVVGTMTWSNRLTAATGTLPATPSWQVPQIALHVGSNTILVVGTNNVGLPVTDQLLIERAPPLPNIHLPTTNLHLYATAGKTNTSPLLISNTGQGVLTFSMSLSSLNTNATSYIWKDSDQQGGPTYSWVDISSSGIDLSLTDEGETGFLPLGFEFPWYETTYTQCMVSANGIITFELGNVDYNEQPLPTSSGTPNPFIAPFWNDLNPSSAGAIRHYSDENQCVISWLAVPPYSGGGAYTFQVILKPNGDLLFQYQTMSGAIDSASIGIQDSNQTNRVVQISYHDPVYIHDALAVKIFPESITPSWISLTPTQGEISENNSSSVWFNVDATSLGTGAYHVVATLLHNDPTKPSISLPVQLNVEESPSIHITTAPATVPYETTTYELGGTHNEALVGSILWTNPLTALTGILSQGTPWAMSSLPLGVGHNPISVTITNRAGDYDSDTVAITRQTRYSREAFWWYERGVLNANQMPEDFALVVQGQLKWMVLNAYEEFEAKLPGGAGSEITTLVNSFANTDNYTAVNLGQLKNVAKPFYNRLWALGMTNSYPQGVTTQYPWNSLTNTPNDYSSANIGQLKYLFSFELQ